MICGVDEAGRGPVIGPMVVAAVMVEDDSTLRDMGVRDSKLLNPSARVGMDRLIREVCSVDLLVISHEQIDSLRRTSSLNEIEAEAFASLLDRLRPSRAYLDACDVDADNFRRMVEGKIGYKTDIICRHKADLLFPVVSAASVVAKVHRDAMMLEIQDEIGEMVGSGYPSDPVTKSFLERWINERGDLPPYTRRSWANAQRLMRLSKNTRITDWK